MITNSELSEPTLTAASQTATRFAVQFEQIVAALDLWLETLDSVDTSQIDGEACVEMICTLRSAQSMVYGRMLKYISAADKADITLTEGRRAFFALLMARARMTPAEVNRALRDARVLREHPRTMDALFAGTISPAHAGAIVDGIKVGAAVEGGSAHTEETMLLELAHSADAGVVRREVKNLRRTLRPKPPGHEQSQGERNAACKFTQDSDGTWHLAATFGPEGGAIVESALHVLMEEQNGQPASESEPNDGQCATPAPSAATAKARARALIQLCSMSLDCGGAHGRGASRPHMLVVLPVGNLRAGDGQPLRTCFGSLLPAPAVERIACDADIALVVVNEEGNPLSVGPFRRMASAEQRLALEVRDQGCVYPGCGLPGGWCEVHWTGGERPGGVVELDDLALVCRLHHIDVHQSGWPKSSRFAGDST